MQIPEHYTNKEPARVVSHAATYSMAGVLVYLATADSAATATIAQLPGATVHASVETKLVVTLEGTDPAGIVEMLTHIQRLPGVMSAALISEHSEPLDTIDEELNDE